MIGPHGLTSEPCGVLCALPRQPAEAYITANLEAELQNGANERKLQEAQRHKHGCSPAPIGCRVPDQQFDVEGIA